MSRSYNQTGQTTTNWILILSIVGNLALALAAMKLLAKPVAPAAPTVTNRFVVVSETQTVVIADASASLTWVTNQFHWRQIESTNYEDYVVNLRAIGCPERTLRDIVLADVERHFATRKRAIETDPPFWTSGKKFKAIIQAKAVQNKMLAEEQVALIQRLLGIEWPANAGTIRMDRFEEQALARFLLGPMADETFKGASKIVDKYATLRKELNFQADGILTDADEIESRKLAASMELELKTLLPPVQWEEMTARMAAAEFKNNFPGVADVNPSEARQIALLAFKCGYKFDFFNMSPEKSAEEQEVSERQFTNSVAQLLGAEKFSDFQRAQDYEFSQIYELAQKNKLPKETAVKVYDIRRLALEEVERLRGDVSLDASAREQQFNQMQSELQKAVSGALGPAVYQDYLRGNGSWITNVTKL